MPAITITDLHKSHGATMLFDGASAAIDGHHRIAVIGRNGAGKSTLCKIILGEETADAGSVTFAPGLRVAYLEQKDPFLPGETVLGFLVRRSGKEDWQCGKLAGRFLLSQELLGREVLALSGGFQTRVRLCTMLLGEPDFLILDEPTNYLDLKTLLLLERFLTDFRGGYLVVSHDRAFLMRTTTSTIEVGRGRIDFHPGTVEAWLDYKQQRRVQAEQVNANLETRRRQLQEFVDRNKAKASKASQAQSKAKLIERLDDERITVDGDDAQVRIAMPSVESRKGVVLRVVGLAIGYPAVPGDPARNEAKTIAKDIGIEIERGHHVAVVGDNGQGKSTFLNTLAARLPPLAGTITWGYDVRVGSYAQHVYSAFDGNVTVQRHLERAATSSPGPMVPTQQILDLAGCFLFRGDDVQKKVGVLSGGERARLCLAGLLLARYPVLLLDEPTNHLDFDTVEALAEALKSYNGTVFFTSHDRTFVSRVADQIIEVKDGQVMLYRGDYAGYCWRLEQEARADEPGAAKPMADKSVPAKPVAAAERSPLEKRTRNEQLGKTKNRLKACERAVHDLDAEKRKLEAALAATYDAEQGERLAQVLKQLDAEEARWVALNEEVEGLES